MRKPSMLVTVFAAAVVAALSAMGACSSPDGVTPDCQFNVGGNGVVGMPNGCEGFAPCVVNGKVRPATECCIDDSTDAGTPLVGDALAICLYGYGAGPAPGDTTSAASSGSSTTSTTSSSGGAGGGDGGS
jgi:hypothetical protein